MIDTLPMGIHLRVLSESFAMNTNMAGKNLSILVHWTKVIPALEGLSVAGLYLAATYLETN